MRQSLMSVFFAAALLIECHALSVALPMGKTDDGSLEQDAFTSLLTDEVAENSLTDADLAATGRTRGPRVIVVADPSLWRDLRVLHNGLSLYKRRADDSSQVIEHRDAGQDLTIPILRRDTMRCMVGRVYRPCWEV
ncbi:pro-melanin-concentrating hormone, like [Micropterus salmoides]|uniref:pro-melanin-concentrating hormone, like n=1 Tax=Micropterus salmoides TaxID=27706 RepID=UPI0018EBB5B2|nr:pro-melanin-concentrating hormone, like [Micropterus salmoides]XP_045923061.1 pro-melanin-concentrating hormone, like [Micropterus dolomieu]